MINCVEIKGLTKEDAVFAELTSNTIILCQNSDLKYKLMEEFEKIRIGEADEDVSNIRYSTGDMEKFEMKIVATYMPTTIYSINNGEQIITLTVEATSILSMKKPEDLWFFGELNNRNTEVYAFTEFSCNKEVWDKGKELEVYKEVLYGKYGTYEGYGL